MNLISAASDALTQSASTAQFFFRVQGVPDGTLTVKSFSGADHGLSQDYRFEISLLADHLPIQMPHPGVKGTLDLRWGVQTLSIHGVLSEFDYNGAAVGGHEYLAVLRSPLHPLKFSRDNRVFLNTTAPQLIDEVLEGCGFASADYELELHGDYPLREFVVQYDESDWDFLLRICAHDGIYFRYAQDEDRVRVIFHDRGEDLPAAICGELLYEAYSGTRRSRETVFALRSRARLLTERVELKDYNDQTPEASLVAFASGSSGAGRDYRYGEHFRDLDEGRNLARVRQQQLDCLRESLVAETDCRALSPGDILSIVGHPDVLQNGDYLIVEVEHEGDQRAGFAFGESAKGMTYRNKLLLIRAGVPFRPPLPAARRLHGLLTARIETSGGDYAHLDEQGRYRLRTDFDLGEAAPGEASHPVRMVQPYTGRDYGFHFPLHAGTEVVISCVNGDLDRPVILGALPNPDTPTPVTSANRTQNILRTWGGNELLMDDRDGKEKTELFTRERKNILSLDADRDGHRVRLATEEGEMEVYAAKTMLLESGDSQFVEVGQDQIVTVENAQRLMTRRGEIEQQAATDIRMKAGENILMQTDQQDIDVRSGRDLIAEVGRNLSMEVRGDNFNLQVVQGKISISAARAITLMGQGGGAIRIGQSGGGIEITPGGDVIISGGSVEVNGGMISLKGGKIGSN
ncbi:type VI secretion system Vgr family protein [Geoalkalibacter sp.]|uniref:type VI secretion system Vgr family protein n=1 Tax=Geoalkalibacter sp. TaxID=3041440 RepID=UPI00272EBB4E|nr:type VI secretion system tip protein TssI/VgrG [Geoalkalibacter sp.]